jgi:hypothetical protein
MEKQENKQTLDVRGSCTNMASWWTSIALLMGRELWDLEI